VKLSVTVPAPEAVGSLIVGAGPTGWDEVGDRVVDLDRSCPQQPLPSLVDCCNPHENRRFDHCLRQDYLLEMTVRCADDEGQGSITDRAGRRVLC
jgi:hypothetical protein